MNNKRETIRKGIKPRRNIGLFLYGRLRQIHKAVAYWKVHRCYLEPKDITGEECNKKKCKYLFRLLLLICFMKNIF